METFQILMTYKITNTMRTNGTLERPTKQDWSVNLGALERTFKLRDMP